MASGCGYVANENLYESDEIRQAARVWFW